MATDLTLSRLVVVGASSGGIDALSTLVSTLTPGFQAPIVIAQHLQPSRASHLAEILSRRSTLPVRTVVDRAPLEPGVVYVVPADRHVQVDDSTVQVMASLAAAHEPHEPHEPAAEPALAPAISPKPSIDHLFMSAAAVYGEGLVAVILTGSGADGAAGARVVKEAGGTVVIQNPATARFPALPRSLAPTTVDVVADIETIGPLLDELVAEPLRDTLPEQDRRLRGLLAQLRERSGIDFSTYKMPTILRRLQRRLIATDSRDLPEYLRYVQHHPEEYQRLIGSFLIKVTGFFRDPDLFRALREQVIPEIVAEARTHDNEVRLWSAGCATGEEAYSLALLVADTLGDELERFVVRVFATDLDAEAVTFARRGVYPPSAVSDVPPDLLERYFTHQDGEYAIRKRVRGLAVFGQHDLGQRAPFPRIDLALCRNVLIYFTPDLQRRALQLFAFALREGGYLALGKAETTAHLADYFMLSDPRLKLYRRRSSPPLVISGARIRDASPLPLARAGPLPPLRPPNERAVPRPTAGVLRTNQSFLRPRRLPELADNLLLRLPVGVVVVDRHYDIQIINATARRLLGIHSEAVGADFLHLVRHVSEPDLRAIVDAALHEPGAAQAPSSHALLAETGDGEDRVLQIDAFPYRPTAEGEPLALVLVGDVTGAVRDRRTLERSLADTRTALDQAAARHQEEVERLARRVRELSDSLRQLLKANQELVEANSRLLNDNEQLLVGHEEAKAATEEVETLNEELQATNEEQETLNEELQATVEELNTTNDDLEARSAELQESSALLDRERAHLRLILDSLPDAIAVVDAQEQVTLANTAYAQTFAAGPDDAPPVFADLAGHVLPPDQTPLARAARGQAFTMRFLRVAPDSRRRVLEARGRPFEDASEQRVSVVIFREAALPPGEPPVSAPASLPAPARPAATTERAVADAPAAAPPPGDEPHGHT